MKPTMHSKRAAILAALTALPLGGCASMQSVENREAVSDGMSYQAQYRAPKGVGPQWLQTAKEQNREKCTVQMTGAQPSALAVMPDDIPFISDGDLISVTVEGDAIFTGTFEISQDGMLRLPHLNALKATGSTVDSIESRLTNALISERIYSVAPRVSVRIQDTAAARVFVSGAVFTPSTVSVGGVSSAERDTLRQQAIGGTTDGRRLSRALQSAGGIRPDADLSRVVIKRGNTEIEINATNALNGLPFNDLMLLDGDHIKVASLGCFQEPLVAPSPVTMPGVKVFMSNLTQPAASNASSAIGKEARELRYGTRFLEAIVGMNCMGGTKLVNANRTAVLISRNPVSGESIVIERNIENMLRDADRDDTNPFMMPGDAMACYDSGTTNIIEVAKGFSTVATVAALLGN